jgi:hypothetical protein
MLKHWGDKEQDARTRADVALEWVVVAIYGGDVRGSVRLDTRSLVMAWASSPCAVRDWNKACAHDALMEMGTEPHVVRKQPLSATIIALSPLMFVL